MFLLPSPFLASVCFFVFVVLTLSFRSLFLLCPYLLPFCAISHFLSPPAQTTSVPALSPPQQTAGLCFLSLFCVFFLGIFPFSQKAVYLLWTPTTLHLLLPIHIFHLIILLTHKLAFLVHSHCLYT